MISRKNNKYYDSYYLISEREFSPRCPKLLSIRWKSASRDRILMFFKFDDRTPPTRAFKHLCISNSRLHSIQFESLRVFRQSRICGCSEVGSCPGYVLMTMTVERSSKRVRLKIDHKNCKELLYDSTDHHQWSCNIIMMTISYPSFIAIINWSYYKHWYKVIESKRLE